MRGPNFTEQVGGIDFCFEELKLNNNEQLFFVSSNMQNERSFFMSKSKNGIWMILYHNILGKEVLKLEPDLSDILKERGF
jgi:hypothetical protein